MYYLPVLPLPFLQLDTAFNKGIMTKSKSYLPTIFGCLVMFGLLILLKLRKGYRLQQKLDNVAEKKDN